MKVVLLGPAGARQCLAALPHEKEWVERFKDRAFVLIGINGDGSKAAADQAMKKHQIPWRSF